jgi:hypothetical protein
MGPRSNTPVNTNPPRKYLKPWSAFWIHRALPGKVLSCGCLAGRYVTYDQHVIETIDHRADPCHAHAVNEILTADQSR